MTNSGSAASDSALLAPDRVRFAIQGVLRAAQATGWTDAALEAASGVPATTIKGYRVEGKEPSLSKALSLAVVIGPAAINPLLALIGYVARPLDEPEAIAPSTIAATALANLSTIVTAAADGRIDHTEEAACREAADVIIATVLPLSSAGKAA